MSRGRSGLPRALRIVLDVATSLRMSAGAMLLITDTNNVTDSGCHCVSADHSSMVVGSVASSSELLLCSPVR